MESVLQLIKPKRLSNLDIAYLYKDQIQIKFSDCTRIIMETNTGINNLECVNLGVKDLYDNNFENANESKFIKYNGFNNSYEKYNIEINVNDLLLFSVLSGVGQDLFCISKVESTENNTIFKVIGLNFYLEYSINKNFNISGYLTWNAYYYLFQMFKHLSGKKVDTLSVSSNDNRIIFNKGYYIVLIQNELRYFNKYFSMIEYNGNLDVAKEIDKKSLIENHNILFKHFARLFGDTIKVQEKINYYCFYNDNCKLYLNKVK